MLEQKIDQIALGAWVSPPNGCGIYLIANKKTGRFYVGASRSLKVRLASHKSLIRSGNHSIKQMNTDAAEHGFDAFASGVLMTCDKEELASCEKMVLDQFDASTLYNRSLAKDTRQFSTKPTSRTNFYFPDAMLEKLRDLSKRTEIAVSEHLRRAVEAYLKKANREK